MPPTGKFAGTSDMNERILRTADRLFYLKGIRAIGVDPIAAEIGISKRTLYNYFPSKDALIAAYLSRRSSPVPAPDLAGCGKSRDFEKMAMKRARYRNWDHIRSMGYGRAPGDEWQRNDDQSTFSAAC